MESVRHPLLGIYADICDNVDPAQVVPYLTSMGVLNEIDLENIYHTTKRRDRVQCLLDILLRSDPVLLPMKHFKDSLSEKYPTIALSITAENATIIESGKSSVRADEVCRYRHKKRKIHEDTLEKRSMCMSTTFPKGTEKLAVSRPLNSVIIDDEIVVYLSERLFCVNLEGDWSKLNSLVNRFIDNQNVDIANYVKATHILRELLTRKRDEYVTDLIHACRDIACKAQYSKYPTLHLAAAFTLESWCLAHMGCYMRLLDLKDSAEGLKKDSLSLLEDAHGYLQTLAPCHATCWIYMMQAIVYLINHSYGQQFTPDAAVRVNQLNALSVDHFLLAEDNGSTLNDSIKRLSRIHLAGALLNFPTSSIVAGIPPPVGLDPPSDRKLKAARSIIKQIQDSFSGIERRCEAYYYLLCSAADVYSKALPEAEENMKQALQIMDTVPGSGPKEAAVAKLWLENQREDTISKL